MVGARTGLNQIVSSWPWKETQLHVTTNAGFSGLEEIQILNNKGIKFTKAVNLSHKRWLFELLGIICPRGSWVAEVDPDGVIFSTKHIENKFVYLATNEFIPMEEIPDRRRPPFVSQQDIDVLGKLSKPVFA